MISLENIANLEVYLGMASKGVLSISHFIKIRPATVVLQHSDRQTRMVSLSLSPLSLPPLSLSLCINAVITLRALSWQPELTIIYKQTET